MIIYTTRYQAKKAAAANGDQKIVKVCGGYTTMNYIDYRVWRAQK